MSFFFFFPFFFPGHERIVFCVSPDSRGEVASIYEAGLGDAHTYSIHACAQTCKGTDAHFKLI